MIIAVNKQTQEFAIEENDNVISGVEIRGKVYIGGVKFLVLKNGDLVKAELVYLYDVAPIHLTADNVIK